MNFFLLVTVSAGKLNFPDGLIPLVFLLRMERFWLSASFDEYNL